MTKKSKSIWIMHVYKLFLWLMGFQTGEYITFMWRRQEARLGILWWLLVATTESLAIILIDSWTSHWHILVTFLVCFLIAIVFWHVATGKVPMEDDPK